MAVTETIWPTEPKIFTIWSSERERRAPNPGLDGIYQVHNFLTLQLVTHTRFVCRSSVKCSVLCLGFLTVDSKRVDTVLYIAFIVLKDLIRYIL